MNDALFATILDSARLPSLLAVQVRRADEIGDSRVQLSTLLHLFENLMRLATAIVIGELRQRYDVAPDRVAQSLLLGMTNPTLDTWRALCAHASRYLGRPSFAPTLPEDIAKLNDLAEVVRRRRNDAAHVPVGGAWAQETLDMLKPRIAEALDGLAWLHDMELFVTVANSRCSIGADARVAISSSAQLSAAVEALRSGIKVELFPFILIIPGSPTSCLGVCRSLTIGWDGVDAYDLGFDGRPSRINLKKDRRLEAFRSWCRYADRRALLGEGPVSKDWTRVPRIFGRDREMRDLAEVIAKNRVTWMEGAAGIGKSLLLEHVARQHRLRGGNLVYWRFATNDPIPPLVLYKHLADKLKTQGTYVPKLGDDTSAWLRHLQLLLKETPPAPTLVILDALDESTTSELAHLPFVLESADLKWLCAGRPNEQLRAIFSADSCQRVELAPLSESALEQWIEVEAPALVVEIGRIKRAAHGLPLYVRIVLNEHDAGRVGVDLPMPGAERLDDFWKAAIQRGASASPTVARWFLDILQVAAESVEPLTPELIRRVLACAGTLVLEGDEDVDFTRALEATSSLLIREESPAGPDLLRPIHSTLIEVLRSEAGYRHSRRQVQRGLTALIECPSDDIARAHVARAGIRQLVAMQRVDTALRLLQSYEWVCMRLFERDGGDAARRVASLVRDLDYISQFAMYSDLEALRSFLASNSDLIQKRGDAYLYQCSANGKLGPFWRNSGAIPWAFKQGSNFRATWLELVSEAEVGRKAAPTIEMSNAQIEPMNTSSETTRRDARAIRTMLFEPDGRHLLTTHSTGPGVRWDTRTGERAVQEQLHGKLLGFDRTGELWLVAQETVCGLRRGEHSLEYRVVSSTPLPGILRGSWRVDDELVLSVQDGADYRLLAVPGFHVRAAARREEAEIAAASALVTTEPAIGLLVAPGNILIGHGHPDRDEISIFQGALTSRGSVRIVNVPNVCVAESANLILCIPLFQKQIRLIDIVTLEFCGSIAIDGCDQYHLVRNSTGPIADTVVFAADGGPLIICNLGARRAVATMRPHLHWCSALALSPDASMLATSDNTDVRVWRCDELLASSPAAALPRCSAVMLLISERADRVARLEYEGDLRVYEFSSGRHIKTHAGFGRPYLGDRSIDGAERYCTASSDGRRIATVDWDGLHVLDIVDDRTYRIFFEGQDEHDPSLLESMRLNSDGSILVVRHWSLDVDEIAWEVETGDRVPVPGVDHQQPVWHAQAAERIALFSDFVSGAAAVWHAEVEIDVATITSDARAAVATSDGAISMLQLRLGGLPS